MKRLKKMELTNKCSLLQLTKELSVMDFSDQSVIIGGGDGSKTNPYSESEADSMIDAGTFCGGYVKDADGTISYWLGVVNVVANSCNYGGYTTGGYVDDPLAPYFYMPIGGVYGYAAQWGNQDQSQNYSGQYNNSCCVNTNNPANLDGLMGWFGTVNTGVNAGAGNTQVGRNFKLYFQTKTGRVFYGNQYVGTTSLEGLSNIVGRYLGPANAVASVYHVYDAYQDEGAHAAAVAAGQEGGSAALAMLLAKAGASAGSVCGPAGTLVGGILGAIGGSLLGAYGGGYLIEITLDYFDN